jgi:hypothetical protein
MGIGATDRGFIEDQDVAGRKERAGQRHELPLSSAEIGPWRVSGVSTCNFRSRVRSRDGSPRCLPPSFI